MQEITSQLNTPKSSIQAVNWKRVFVVVVMFGLIIVAMGFIVANRGIIGDWLEGVPS